MKHLTCRLIIIMLTVVAAPAFAQSDYIDLGNKQYQLLDRLDILTQHDSLLGFSTVKSYDRRKMTVSVQQIDSLDKAGALPFRLSATDRYNIRRMSDFTNTTIKTRAMIISTPVVVSPLTLPNISIFSLPTTNCL